MKEGKKEKISEMVEHFAREYLSLGEDIEHKQQLLNSAATAWNIACLNEQKREEAIEKYLKEWKRLNPANGKDMLKAVEEDLRLLIKRKLELYPDIKKQIINVHIQDEHGKNRITVASVTLK
ncbi:hypothetical protein KsCSTR_09440 [Candidatus Kuenenia stuttgartiensis]|uniref:Uncharacterized protein n=1 Tax=Kuenenia stuttgartiensis TaxID=174633 RepID=Q1PZ03_KUEST|nr:MULTISPECIES: hypothetical protein [Kuenenia]MBE7547419.1 hypothetical protein [Planctomycetia bacterium]MBZ0191756.1 hypothetical protein [Candidatus Kuenenia stuttgartiensis]MCF6152868.1 hypothetical protein [Candidatus Kuenenia stuttgartiensis]MCL4727896.1 hypothetical protein [Candidatus Kuenenia stuttgartiensis]MCZ7623768.1 hypothetical protein [Candidatus Kuenenia sp.]